jgi:DNA repair protein RecN (Recombination protein N)
MLRFLSIQHLAIIESLGIEFSPGLNVLTGETGAGKSIVVGAIDLLLGGRAASDLVRTGADVATVQAIVETIDNKELIVRRELSSSGRSRAFLDDALVTATRLREVMAPLVDLHGQHEHQQLLDPSEHLPLLDAFAHLDAERAEVARAWTRLCAAREAAAAIAMDERERHARLEMARFQLAEIDRVSPREGEDDALLAERKILQNADRLLRLAGQAYQDLYESEGAALARLAGVWKRLDELAVLDPRFLPFVTTRDAVQPVLQDLAFTLRGYSGELDASPERLQQVEDRLASLERLKRRYGLTLADVCGTAVALRETVSMLERSAGRRAELEVEVNGARAAYASAAGRLSEARQLAAPDLSARVERELRPLAMERARCEFRVSAQPDVDGQWGSTGFDRGEFMLSANPGEDPRPLARIASGGELSRVMLAMKTVASTDAPGKTLVFDEVDSGVSGRVADTVGRRLHRLGERFQVICVTHLPQVASWADAHYRVEKVVSGGRTSVSAVPLPPDARVVDVARLLAGQSVSPAAVETAREMLQAAGESKDKTKGERAKVKGESARKVAGAKVPR